MAELTHIDNPAPGVPLPEADVIIFPLAFEGEVGIYSESVLLLAKRLRAEGISAEYLNGPENRTWLGLNGTPVGLSILIGFLTSGGVAAVQSWLVSSLGKTRLRFKGGRNVNADGSVDEWFEAVGTGEDIARVLEAWKGTPSGEITEDS